jgi:Domain of unknown function (DUF4404)
MISERLARLEATLRNNTTIPEVARQELLALVVELKTEVAPLASTHGEIAQEIAGSAEAAVHATVQEEPHPERASEAVQGLAASVRQFEVSHPRLVEIVDQLALMLSNLGI